jgi:PfaB family protein
MQKIAVIGIACLFPGADTIEQFKQNLFDNKDSTSPHSIDQMGVDPDFFYHPRVGEVDKYYSRRGGYIQDFKFDPSGYNLPPTLLEKLDDVYKWSLTVARDALKDSGYINKEKVLSKCGVILGNLSFPTKLSNQQYLPIYHRALESSARNLIEEENFSLSDSAGFNEASFLNSRISGYPAALVAEALSLSGTDFCLDAACASSLYSVKLASDYLQSGQADLMLAGSVSAGDPFFVNLGFSTFTAYPENDESCPLDKKSQGLVSGEGAGMFVLKRYEDALRDGDKIYASICGVGLSNDGRGRSVLRPNPDGQYLAYERAYASSEISPSDIFYVEAHATGTPDGDPPELTSLDRFFGKHNAKPLIGSVKSNFGHLLTTAGMASMIKVILSMSESQIPATIKVSDPFSSPNHVIEPGQIVSKNRPWSAGAVKHAAVNAIGFGGTNAHLVFDQQNAKDLAKSKASLGKKKRSIIKPKTGSMAIVGMDAHFGACQNLDEFNYSIYTAEQNFTPLPPERWKGIEDYPTILDQYGITDKESLTGAFISDFEFDISRYRIPPNEVESMIPQQLLMLKVADQAIQDAKIKEGGNVGVIICMEADRTLHQLRGRIDLTWKVKNALDSQQAEPLEEILKDALRDPVRSTEFTSLIGNIMASRISALWDFSGPSFTLSANENSVFKALEISQLMLSSGEVDAMVVGAVDLAGNFEDVLIRNHLMSNFNTESGSFYLSQNTNGWMIGEGAGAVVVKLPETANKEKDRSYAVIDAIGLSRGKVTTDIVENSKLTQKKAGIKAGDIGYLEVTGPGLDIETEIKGLVQSFHSSSRDLTCALGSVTANFGYSFAASGMTSLIKNALCLHHRYVPGVPEWSKPKSDTAWEDTAFYVAAESRTWFTGDEHPKKRIAALNSLSTDGSIAHVILSEPVTHKKILSKVVQQTPLYIFPVTGEDAQQLTKRLEELHARIVASTNLHRDSSSALSDDMRFARDKYSAVILGDSQEKLLKEIDAAIQGLPSTFEKKGDWTSPMGSYLTADPLAQSGKLAYVYPGAFNAYIGMNRELFQLFPDLQNLVDSYSSRPDTMLREKILYPRSLKALTEADRALLQNQLEENAIANFETGINAAILNTAVLRGIFGVQPQSAFGYSMGEVSMAFSLGVWESTDKMSSILHSDPLFQERLAGSMDAARELWGLGRADQKKDQSIWECYTVAASAEEIEALIADKKHVYILIINSPHELVIAGETQAVREVVKSIDHQCTLTPMSDTIHCEVVKSEYDQVANLHTSPISQIPNVQFYSAAAYTPTEISSETLADNIANIYCKTIDYPKLVSQVYQDGARIFVEVGPKSNCSKWINEILHDKPHLAISLDRKGAGTYITLLRALAQLHSHRVPIDFSAIYGSDTDFDHEEKSLKKSVTLGGSRIRPLIENEQNRLRLHPVIESPPAMVQSPLLPDPVPKPEPIEVEAIPVITAEMVSGDPGSIDDIHKEMGLYRSQISRTHSAFLETRNASLKQLKEIIGFQLGAVPEFAEQIQAAKSIPVFSNDPYLHHIHAPGQKQAGVIWNESDLLEFAEGKIATVFGDAYKIIDTYDYRVRLPLPPYLLVNRVVELTAEINKFEPSSLTTEYDIPHKAWYSVDGQIPWAIASESGQCDLLLISFLGIDFLSQGNRYYRLTDYTMTFMDELPKEGDTLRYEIQIKSFMKSGDAWAFYFGYDCYVREKLVYKMTGGRAGFSSMEELAQGKGVVISKMEEQERKAIPKQQFQPLLVCSKLKFDRTDLLNVTRGNISSCFGSHYDQRGKNPSLRFASEEMLMLDRIVSLDPQGGPWGLGEVIAEKDLAPDDWYFPCHFKDDNVLAGTLITEGCVQLLGFYMLYLGLQIKTGDARFQPIQNRPYSIRARGQIVPSNTQYSYKMEIVEIGLNPRPFVRANFYIIMDGKILVDFRDLGVELLEKNPSDPAYRGLAQPIEDMVEKALFDERVIEELATGSLSKCFGPEFAVYDNKRGPRTPNGDLQLVSRIMSLEGTRHNFKKEVAEMVSEYDVPAAAWFIEQNAYPVTPYSIIMEIALQPPAFLSVYLGVTLLYPDVELGFRNLGSKANLIYIPDLRGKTVVSRTKMVSVANVAETVIVTFEYDVCCDGLSFYQGTTQFGYFTPKALSIQKGLDRGEKVPPWFKRNGLNQADGVEIDLTSPENRNQYFSVDPTKPSFRLAGEQLEFLDSAVIFEKGGQYNQGYVYGFKKVDPSDWFYPCHFYKDPVMPGSLGVEAILQAVRLFALQQELGNGFRSPHFGHVPGTTEWKYSGQIIPDNDRMEIEVHIKTIDQLENKIIIKADANLWKDGIRIYQITDAAVSLEESQIVD